METATQMVIPLTWNSGSWRWNATLSNESQEAIEKMIAQVYSKEFASLFRYGKGISLWYSSPRNVGRDRAGAVVKLEKKHKELDFTKYKKKFDEMYSVFVSMMEAQKKRGEYKEALSDFCKTVDIDGIEKKYDRWDENHCRLQANDQDVIIYTDDNGTITEVNVKKPSYFHGSFDEIIEEATALKNLEQRAQQALIGKNIYNQ